MTEIRTVPKKDNTPRAALHASLVDLSHQSIKNQLLSITWITACYVWALKNHRIILVSACRAELMGPLLTNSFPLQHCTHRQHHAEVTPLLFSYTGIFTVISTEAESGKGRMFSRDTVETWAGEGCDISCPLLPGYLSPAGLAASICPTCDKLKMKSHWQL